MSLIGPRPSARHVNRSYGRDASHRGTRTVAWNWFVKTARISSLRRASRLRMPGPRTGPLTLALSAVTLAVPVMFGHPSNDPVDVVLAFASPDRNAHVGMLAALARHLARGLRDRLLTATSNSIAITRLQEVVDDVD